MGRAVVKHLMRSECRVLALDRIDSMASEDATGCQTIQCDLADPRQLRRVFEQQRFAGIVHLAAILPTAAQRNPQMATQVNVQGSAKVLEMARQFRVPRVVFGSSLSVYGTYAADRTVSEDDRAAPEDLYGAAKLYIEQLGGAYRECYGVNFVSLRIGRVVGPGAQSATSAWRSEIFELLKASYPAEIRIPYAASERILVLHVEDLAMMLGLLLKAERTEHAIYNAPCRSILVGDLRRAVEDLNSHVTVLLGNDKPLGNPQVIDFSRFQNEFKFESVSIFDRLRKAAAR